MKYGFEGNKFFVEIESCKRPVLNMRQESRLRAKEIYETNKKILLCLSSGLDSQIALQSFKDENLPVECVFFKYGKYNLFEYENLKLLEEKFGIKAEIIDIDIDKYIDEILNLSLTLNVHPNHAIHHLFSKRLPDEYSIIQVFHDPWILTRKKDKKNFVYFGLQDPEIARIRAFSSLESHGKKIINFGNSSEFFLSILTDSILQDFLVCSSYYEGNKIQWGQQPIHDVHRYDYYVKPFLYAKYWKNDLLYFPKFRGYENITWIKELENRVNLRHINNCYIELNNLIKFLLSANPDPLRILQHD